MIADSAAEPPAAPAASPRGTAAPGPASGTPGPESIRKQKTRLRSRARRARSELTAGHRVQAAHGFAAGLQQLVEQQPDGPVLAFLPLPMEPPLTDALQDLITRREVLLPVTLAQRRMLWTRWLPETEFTHSGPGGLREATGTRMPAPESPGLVLVPALAIGADGTRLGMGGGFYDTFLEGLPRSTPIVGCAYSWEVLPAGAVPAQPWDAVLPRVLTERGLQTLRDAGDASHTTQSTGPGDWGPGGGA